MTEDDSHVDPRAMANSDHFDEALLYDFAKFLTTLALLALGGLLTLIQAADKTIAKKPVVAFVAGAIAMAGICAVSAAIRLVKVAPPKRPPRLSPRNLVLAAIGFLGIGAGGFLMMWWKTLG